MPKGAVLNLTPEERRYALKGRLKEAVADPGVTEASLFQKFYQDPSGREYWASWLTEQHEDLGSFVDLLAAHNAKNYTADPAEIGPKPTYQNKAFHRPLYRALIDAAERREPWLEGETSSLRDGSFEKSSFSLFTLAGRVKVARRPMVEWLLSDPNYRDLVPRSALPLFGTDSSPSAQPEPAPSANKGRSAGTNLNAVDRKLFPEIDRILAAGGAEGVLGAALKLTDRIVGRGAPYSRARRVANLYIAERKSPSRTV